MARINNLTNFLQDVADAIKEKKEYESTQKIAAEDFDIEIASIETGIDTSDATATADDILNPKTAYVDGQKLTGAITASYTNDILKQSIYIAKNDVAVSDIHYKAKVAAVITSSTLTFYRINNNEIDVSSETAIDISSWGLAKSIKFKFACNMLDNDNILFCVSHYTSKLSKLWTGKLNLTNLSISNISSSTKTLGQDGRINAFIPINGTNNEWIYATMTNWDDMGWIKGIYFGRIYVDYDISYDINISWKTLSVGNGNLTIDGSEFLIDCSPDGNIVNLSGQLRWRARLQDYLLTRENAMKDYTVKNSYYTADSSLFYRFQPISNTQVVKNKAVYNISNLNTQVGTFPLAINNDTNAKVIPNNNELIVIHQGDTYYYVKSDTYTIQTFRITGDSNRLSMIYTNDEAAFIYDSTTEAYVTPNIEKLVEITDMTRKTIKYYETLEVDAEASDILLGKKVFGADGKMTGTMPNNGSLTYVPSTSQQTIPAGYTSGGAIAAINNQNKTVIPTTSQQIIIADNGYDGLNQVTVNAVDSTIDNNIQAENIKYGISILDIEGTYIGEEGTILDVSDNADISVSGSTLVIDIPPYTELEYI